MNTDPNPASAETGHPPQPDETPEKTQPAPAHNATGNTPGGQPENAEALATYAVTLFVNSAEAPLLQPGGAAEFKASKGWQPPESSLRLRDRSV